eukprot:Phypoly_transcript_04115.p1 GENE.Phypoly_transcript_04115~~Phypoly_transcript_04115.p1  ORF type:complete len:451 (+),score=85.71 Phypoly_transcript_04115:152-1504(+)
MPMQAIRKYSMTMSNRMYSMILFLALIYVLTIYILTRGGSLPWGHERDSHRDLHVADEIIVILGYRLHPDGMATRILRDRVERAANLYKELMEASHHPLIIVSGKGKSEIGYTEAEVMMEWCSFMGVRKDDILVDSESTNTAQNAKFSAELIRNKTGIHQVYVVTSDYHILRAQYIFQTVFPTTVNLDFASSATPAHKFAEAQQKERVLMKSSRDDLVAENLLDPEENGSHPISTYPLWQMVSRELDNDVRAGVTDYDDESVTVADYAGAHGPYFSNRTAVKFPKGRVLTIVDELPVNATRGENYCHTTADATQFTRAQRLGVIYTYQLCFDVFHWWPSNATREEWEGLLAAMLMNARTTFFELPEAMKYRGREGQPNWELLNRWYDGRNETQILTDVALSHGFHVQHKLLGPTMHARIDTLHKLMRVDVVGLTPQFRYSDFLAAYNCSG